MILVDVCHTMHFAHGKRVIHRDLKPQNIMIGRAGETLVVDWGMAKIISGQDAEEQHDLHPILPPGEDQLTQDGAIQGTLPYMSPEQARGALTLGPATDIFALGAILFQVLTGKHPYHEADSKSVSYPRVMEGKYTPLVSLRPDIPAALAAMVDKALAKNPSDRYRHAKELADDIQLWLADEQVSVHVDTKYESLTRWMRRNDFRVITSIGALLLVALTAVTAFVLVNSARRAEEKQRIIAEQALAKSVQYFQQEREAVETWLTTAAEVMRYYPGVQKAREQMLTKAAEHYERSVEQTTSDNRLELERARNYLRLGDVYVLRRQDHEAEKAYELGEELFAKLSQAIPALDTQSGWAECRMRRAMLQAELGQMAAARELLVETRRMLTGEDDKSLEMRAFCFANEGKLRLDSREYDTARQLLSNAETDFEKLAVQQPEHVKYRQALAGVMNRHGQVLVALGLLEEGKGKLVQACSKFESLARSAPDDPAPLEQLSHTRIALATVFRALGQREEESQQYAAALRDYERLNQALPDVPIYLESIGLTLVDHAQLLVEMGEYSQALEHLDRALDLFTRLRENFSQFPRYQEEFATSADAKGDLLRDQNKLAEAEDWLKQAISGLESLTKNYADIPAYWERLAISRLRLAQVFEMRMQDASAIAQYRQALEDLGQVKSLVESVQNSQAIIHWYLGEALLRTAEKAEAQRELSAARDLWEQLALSSPSPETIAYRVRFMTHCMEPSFRAMPVALKQAKHITSTTPNNADYWLLQAQVHYRSQQTAEGLEALKKAMALREKPQARDLITQALLQLQAKEDAAAQKSFAEGEKLHAQQHPGRRDARILLEEAQALLTPPSDTTQPP
jgi:tetratricopeptide (TPR) repeat protein